MALITKILFTWASCFNCLVNIRLLFLEVVLKSVIIIIIIIIIIIKGFGYTMVYLRLKMTSSNP